MESVVRSLVSFFSRSGSSGGHEVGDTAPAPGSPEAGMAESSPAVDLSLEVARLHTWLIDRRNRDSSGEPAAQESILSELRRRIRDHNLSRIPRQPRVLPRLIRALRDEFQTHTDVARIIQDEPALTDELLRVVNATLEKPGQRPVESVQQAVLLIGFDGVRRAVSEAVMRPVMQGASRAEANFARNAWRWGLTCATACDYLEQQEKGRNSDLFMIGLTPAFAYLTIYRELETIALDQTGNRRLGRSTLDAALDELVGEVLVCLTHAWQLPAHFVRQLDELDPVPLGSAESLLSKGMIVGTHKVLRQAGFRTLTWKELMELTRIPPKRVERLQAQLE